MFSKRILCSRLCIPTIPTLYPQGNKRQISTRNLSTYDERKDQPQPYCFHSHYYGFSYALPFLSTLYVITNTDLNQELSEFMSRTLPHIPLSSATCSHTPPIHVLPFVWENEFHTDIKQQLKWNCTSVHLNVQCLETGRQKKTWPDFNLLLTSSWM
jgi:hypothetical protein